MLHLVVLNGATGVTDLTPVVRMPPKKRRAALVEELGPRHGNRIADDIERKEKRRRTP